MKVYLTNDMNPKELAKKICFWLDTISRSQFQSRKEYNEERHYMVMHILDKNQHTKEM